MIEKASRQPYGRSIQSAILTPLAGTVLRRVWELLRSRPFPYVADVESAPSPLRPPR